MAKVMDISELKDLFRFVVKCTWDKKNPNPGEDHQDKKAKKILSDLLGQQPPEVKETFTFNLCGERTFLITGLTLSPDDLAKFVKMITEDGFGNLTNVKVEFAPKKWPTEKDKVVSVGNYFQGSISPEPGGYRFVAKLWWDPNDEDDKAAQKTITDIVTKVQNQGPQHPEIPGINPLIQCDILVGDQTAWIVGFAHNTNSEHPQSAPENLQRFISKMVYKGVINSRVSHATSGPQVNTILNDVNQITGKKRKL